MYNVWCDRYAQQKIKWNNNETTQNASQQRQSEISQTNLSKWKVHLAGKTQSSPNVGCFMSFEKLLLFFFYQRRKLFLYTCAHVANFAFSYSSFSTFFFNGQERGKNQNKLMKQKCTYSKEIVFIQLPMTKKNLKLKKNVHVASSHFQNWSDFHCFTNFRYKQLTLMVVHLRFFLLLSPSLMCVSPAHGSNSNQYFNLPRVHALKHLFFDFGKKGKNVFGPMPNLAMLTT